MGLYRVPSGRASVRWKAQDRMLPEAYGGGELVADVQRARVADGARALHGVSLARRRPRGGHFFTLVVIRLKRLKCDHNAQTRPPRSYEAYSDLAKEYEARARGTIFRRKIYSEESASSSDAVQAAPKVAAADTTAFTTLMARHGPGVEDQVVKHSPNNINLICGSCWESTSRQVRGVKLDLPAEEAGDLPSLPTGQQSEASASATSSGARKVSTSLSTSLLLLSPSLDMIAQEVRRVEEEEEEKEDLAEAPPEACPSEKANVATEEEEQVGEVAVH